MVMEQHISIPIFQKDELSLDYAYPGGFDWNDVSWPTLEHLLWTIFTPALQVQPNHSSSYLRKKVKQKDGMKQMIQAIMDPETRSHFIRAWKMQIGDNIQKYVSLKDASFYCVIPRNKQMYKELGYNPDIEGSMNRLGDLFGEMIASLVEEKSAPTTRDDREEEMMRDTFCPDCESLLFIRQTKDEGESSFNLVKKCSVCGWEKTVDDDQTNKPIYESKGGKTTLILSDHDIEEILQDPTLPRINNIPCVNPLCATNHLIDDEFGFLVESLADKVKRETISKQDNAETIGSEGIILFESTEEALKQRIRDNGLNESDGTIMKGPVKRYILYYRTNADDLKYSYVCSTCKTVWSNS